MAGKEWIYLDHNATTPVDPEVFEAMKPFFTGAFGNPSSPYDLGKSARNAIDHAREQVATLAGCQPGQVIFTSGGTEADNTALNDALRRSPDKKHVLYSAVEHSAVRTFCQGLRKRGYEVERIPVDRTGALDLDHLESLVRPDTAVAAVMWANNETGVLFPVEEIAARLARHDVPLVVDGVQAAGKLPLQFADKSFSYLALSAHKINGPKGTGALIAHRAGALHPLIIGGGQEEGRRGGTENVAGIVGFGQAAEKASRHAATFQSRVGPLRDEFEQKLKAIAGGCWINGETHPRLANTSSVGFEGLEAEAILLMLNRQKVACSTGSACTTGALEPSHVLTALGLNRTQAKACLRFSFGGTTSRDQMEEAVSRLATVLERLRSLTTGSGPVSTFVPSMARADVANL